jgi:hypothetical protein
VMCPKKIKKNTKKDLTCSRDQNGGHAKEHNQGHSKPKYLLASRLKGRCCGRFGSVNLAQYPTG